MTFNKNIFTLWNRRFISPRVFFVPVGLLFAASTVNLQSCPASSTKMTSPDFYKEAKSMHEFTAVDSYGNDVPLDKYKGNVVLIVNIASNCGLTKNNYAKLMELKNKYYDSGLRILSFPCNQFAYQMPEEDGEPMVCHLKAANAEFGDVFKKINVNGDDAIPLYKFLKDKLTGTLGISFIKWNFTKFLVDKNGIPVERFSPTTDPMAIAKKIEELLKA